MNVTAAPLRRLMGSALLALAVGLSGCTSGGTPDQPQTQPKSSPGASVNAAKPEADEPVAVIGGKSIKRSELTDRLMAGYGAEVLREMMLHEAVRLEAQHLSLKVGDDELDRELRQMSEGYGSEQEFYAAMQQQLGMDRGTVREDAEYRLLLEKLSTRGVDVPEAEIRGYYDEHKQDFGPRKQYHLAWILTNKKEAAERVLSELENGTDFADLAARYSVDEMTAQSGGDLGWVDDLDPYQDAKLMSAARQLHVGEAAGPLKTDQGYVVLELKGEKAAAGKDYADAREDIRRQLALEKAAPMHDLEVSLLGKYGAKVLDPRLNPPGNGQEGAAQ